MGRWGDPSPTAVALGAPKGLKVLHLCTIQLLFEVFCPDTMAHSTVALALCAAWVPCRAHANHQSFPSSLGWGAGDPVAPWGQWDSPGIIMMQRMANGPSSTAPLGKSSTQSTSPQMTSSTSRSSSTSSSSESHSSTSSTSSYPVSSSLPWLCSSTSCPPKVHWDHAHCGYGDVKGDSNTPGRVSCALYAWGPSISTLTHSCSIWIGVSV